MTILMPLLGGALMGTAATLFLWTHGRIAGIAGMYSGALERTPDRMVRVSFVVGLLTSGLVLCQFLPDTLPKGSSGTPVGIAALAGLLVGYGARLGSGCTSGHGICGMSLLSRRALFATAVFMTMGTLAATFVRHWIGGGR